MLQRMFGVLEAMQWLLPETTLGQCDASQRPDNRILHAWISIFCAHCVVQHWFHHSNRSQISISILVFQLANVTGITQGNISHISWISFLSSVRRNKCHIALCLHGRIWEVLEGQGDPPVLCSFNPKSCMKTAVDALTWSIHSCTMYSRCIQLKFCNKLKHISKLFFIPIYSSLSTSKWSVQSYIDLCWTGILR